LAEYRRGAVLNGRIGRRDRDTQAGRNLGNISLHSNLERQGAASSCTVKLLDANYASC